MSGRYRTGKIDKLYQSGGGYLTLRDLIPQRGGRVKKRRTRKRRRRRPQRGRGIKKKLAGKALAFLGKNVSKGLDLLSKNVKNKKSKSILDNELLRKGVGIGSKYIEAKGNKWYNE